jgi:hypothetical protein
MKRKKGQHNWYNYVHATRALRDLRGFVWPLQDVPYVKISSPSVLL